MRHHRYAVEPDEPAEADDVAVGRWGAETWVRLGVVRLGGRELHGIDVEDGAWGASGD